MAQQGGNQNLPPSVLCRLGCGFYGNPMYDGMCSKCHKDALKRRQQTSSPTQLTGRMSPLTSVCGSSEKTTTDSASQVSLPARQMSIPASVETASPTVSTPTLVLDKAAKTDTEKEQDLGAVASVANTSRESTPSEPEKKPKKNRCHTCKKKVGLTGFACRCGGLYCGMHRYSDKHHCSFNYKELAQEEIRKSNPVIIAEKVQKI